VKHVRRLYAVSSSDEDHCALAVMADDDEGLAGAAGADHPFALLICNSLGTTVDQRPLPLSLEPLHVCVTSSYAFAASRETVLAWRYRTARAPASTARTGAQRGEQLFHVDESPTGVGNIGGLDSLQNASSTQDPICCIGASDKVLIVGRESGTLQRYSLPNIALTHRYSLATKPHRLAVNCNSTLLSAIDATGLLQVIAFINQHFVLKRKTTSLPVCGARVQRRRPPSSHRGTRRGLKVRAQRRLGYEVGVGQPRALRHDGKDQNVRL